MEHLAGALLHAVARRVEYITVALAKRVVHLHHDGAQDAALVVSRSVAVPETHWFERVAQHARVGVQPEFTGGVMDAFALQQLVDPGDSAALLRRATVPMVGLEEAQRPGLVDGPACVLCSRLLQAAQGQHQKVGGVNKGVMFGPLSRVAHLAKTDEGGAGFHAVASAAPASASNRAAAAKPALSPSSWNP